MELLRVLVDPPQSGVVNMAVDEAILTAVNEGRGGATLRFYQWDEPTISLGYFQEYHEVGDQNTAVAAMPVVRRQTGGGAILHDQELTYSLVLPLTLPGGFTDIEAMYRLMHEAFIAALRPFFDITYRGGSHEGNSQRGPFFCFAREHPLDLVVRGDKILGSAQRRRSQAVLQHGSLILGRRYLEQPAAAVWELVSEPFLLDGLIREVTRYVAEQMGLTVELGTLNELEQDRSRELQQKYISSQWNRQR